VHHLTSKIRITQSRKCISLPMALELPKQRSASTYQCRLNFPNKEVRLLINATWITQTGKCVSPQMPLELPKEMRLLTNVVWINQTRKCVSLQMTLKLSRQGNVSPNKCHLNFPRKYVFLQMSLNLPIQALLKNVKKRRPASLFWAKTMEIHRFFGLKKGCHFLKTMAWVAFTNFF